MERKLRMHAWHLVYKHKIISKLIDFLLDISKKLLNINDECSKELEVTVEKLKKG